MAKSQSKFKRILSIDGGGIRGIIPGQVMVSIEEKLKKITGDPDTRIADHFDLLAGTSTGGILTCAYLLPDPSAQNAPRPKYNAGEVVNFYMNRGAEIFHVPLQHKIASAGGLIDEKYPIDGMNKALQDYFGDAKLSELLQPCLITSYDVKRRQGHFFNQHDAIKDDAWNYLVRDVARATSAAPTYFECSKINSLTGVSYPLVDGGVFVNNPALCAYAEVHSKNNVSAKNMTILSIGTGYTRKEYDYDAVKNWGMAQWVKPLIDIMMSGVADVVDYQLRQIYHAVGAPNQYLRINTAMPGDVSSEMDNASPENLLALKELGTELAQTVSDDIDAFLALMMEENLAAKA